MLLPTAPHLVAFILRVGKATLPTCHWANALLTANMVLVLASRPRISLTVPTCIGRLVSLCQHSLNPTWRLRGKVYPFFQLKSPSFFQQQTLDQARRLATIRAEASKKLVVSNDCGCLLFDALNSQCRFWHAGQLPNPDMPGQWAHIHIENQGCFRCFVP